MKFFTKLFFLLVCTLSLFFSCSKDEFNTELNNRDVLLKTDTLTFIYNNITYSSPYYYVEDSIVVLNENVREVFDRIMSNENKYILIQNSRTTIFNSIEEYQNKIENDSLLLTHRITKAGEDDDPYFEIKAEFANHIPLFGAVNRDLTITQKGKLRKGNNISIPTVKKPDLRVYGLQDRISWGCITLTVYNMIPSSNFSGNAHYTLFLGYDFEGKNTGTGCEANVLYNPQNPLIQEGVNRVNYRKKSLTTDFRLRCDITGEVYNDRAKSLKVYGSYSYNDNSNRESDSVERTSDGSSSGKRDSDRTGGRGTTRRIN